MLLVDCLCHSTLFHSYFWNLHALFRSNSLQYHWSSSYTSSCRIAYKERESKKVAPLLLQTFAGCFVCSVFSQPVCSSFVLFAIPANDTANVKYRCSSSSRIAYKERESRKGCSSKPLLATVCSILVQYGSMFSQSVCSSLVFLAIQPTPQPTGQPTKNPTAGTPSPTTSSTSSPISSVTPGPTSNATPSPISNGTPGPTANTGTASPTSASPPTSPTVPQSTATPTRKPTPLPIETRSLTVSPTSSPVMESMTPKPTTAPPTAKPTDASSNGKKAMEYVVYAAAVLVALLI